jgi:hypothetical protein
MDSDRTLDQCANICSGRLGCTGFEFFKGPGVYTGFCGTYTAGVKNVQTGVKSTKNWQSCLEDRHQTDSTAGPTTQVCPAGYSLSEYDLAGLGKSWAPADTSRTIAQCGEICGARAGCTGFEFFEGEAAYKGHCATYTGGDANVRTGKMQATGWRSCVGKTETPAPVQPLCPAGFAGVGNNLDGFGKKWEKADNTRTIAQCAEVCKNRAGCTGFEYFKGAGAFHGFCASYTGGNSNIKSNMQGKDWQSCVLPLVASSASNKLISNEASSESTVELLSEEEIEAMMLAEISESDAVANSDENERHGPSVSGAHAAATITGAMALCILAVLGTALLAQ